MRFYWWTWLIFIVLAGCSENGAEQGDEQIAGAPLPPKMHLHRDDVPDDLWGPDALTDADGIYIEWEANAEADLADYHIHRSINPDSGYERIDSVSDTVTFYEDLNVKPETKYYYRVTATDRVGNESRMSEAACYTLLRKSVLTHPPNQAILNSLPTFRWFGIGETGFYTLRVFVSTGDTENPFREIWHYETIDFDQFEVTYNQDGTATESLLPGREYRWRVDFEERATVGSESTWHSFQMQP
ncbi:MAG: fibronectin type III domain-containing protein [Candidatus Poribacteria bacterium]|nr:fibronectin type III domain-containing protein [Candidatus Poribacteria bacterium]